MGVIQKIGVLISNVPIMQSLHEKQTLLRSIKLFSCMTELQMSDLLKIITFEHFPKYSFVYREFENSDSFYFLIKGSIKIAFENEEKREIVTGYLNNEGLFGEKCITGESYRKDFVQALSDDVEILKVNSKDFFNMFVRDVPTQMILLNILANKISTTESRIESLIGKDARSRIIAFLKQNIISTGKKIGYEVMMQNNMTQQDIANYTGTSRQTVTQVFNELKKMNIIHFNRRNLLVRDMARLI